MRLCRGMEHRYRQLMRKVRLYLLTEVRKKSWTSRFLSAKIFDPVYWSWTRESVAVGAGWGAAAAIAPLPMQSLWGVFACLWRKGNIPVAILMAWLSPPGFTFFAIPAQWWLGWFLFSRFGLPTSGATWHMLKTGVEQWSWAPFNGLGIGMVSLEFLTGWAVSSVVLGGLCYGLVQLGWWLGLLIKGRRKHGEDGKRARPPHEGRPK
ncbi:MULTISPECIES: DUF2062 domain-containing protein [Akkermansia]|nr:MULTISPECIES: DUF2062 domain-containing protein [Akkermansia]MBT8794847.1 DUF2062 domain-containing protein [Akkermansia muciniphila]